MSILNKYKEKPISLVINRSNIMDIVVSDSIYSEEIFNESNRPILLEDGLIAYIDSSNRRCVDYDSSELFAVYSPIYHYKESESTEDIVLNNIKLTGYDNGLLTPDVSAFDFPVKLDYNDNTFTLYRVSGYTGSNSNFNVSYNENNRTINFNGGFLQGFYKIYGTKYSTLPQYIENGEWDLEFVLSPKSLGNNNIFFYMGTRAENKFANIYNDNELSKKYGNKKTSNGISYSLDKFYEIKTDNKYLDEYISGVTRDYDTNPYLLFNQTENGYTVDNIDEYHNSKEKVKYDVLNDLYENAFALYFSENGSIGYKYLIKDCDSEDDSAYEIVSEETKEGLVSVNEWHTINVKMSVSNGRVDSCSTPKYLRSMKIYIYVDGYLKLISKELPEFNFKELDDIKEKQECVPFNISLGGGTLGLSDSCFVDKVDNKMVIEKLPDIGILSNHFNGRFYGDMKTFKFYNKHLTINEIKNNHYYNNTLI